MSATTAYAEALRDRIRVLVGIIVEANEELVRIKERPVNVCMTPTDCEPWVSIARRKRRGR